MQQYKGRRFHLFHYLLISVTLLLCVLEDIDVIYPLIAIVLIRMNISILSPRLTTPNSYEIKFVPSYRLEQNLPDHHLSDI